MITILRPGLRTQLDPRRCSYLALWSLSLGQDWVLQITQGQGHMLSLLLPWRIWELICWLYLWDSQCQPRPFCQGPDTEPYLPLIHCWSQAPQDEERKGLGQGRCLGSNPGLSGFFSTFSQCNLKESHRLPELIPLEMGKDNGSCFVGLWRPPKNWPEKH